MRLRDLPGLADKLDKHYRQIRGYVERLPRGRKKKNPYTSVRR